MESEQLSETSITVTELKGGGAGGDRKYTVLDDGTYEAEYQKMRVFMDNTPWGEKKCARLYFKITRGKYANEMASFKGTFFLDKDTNAWVVGSKSKLGDAIRAVAGGKTLDDKSIGTKVFIVVKQKVSKKSGNPYSFIDSIIPRPTDEQPSVAAAAQAAAPQQQAPVQQQAPQAQPAPQAQAKPAVPPADAGDAGLLEDLTELSDFQE